MKVGCASAEDEKENVDDKGKKPMREEDLPQAQDAEEEEEADDSPGNRTDMELAWENLEVAKLIYERENAASYAKELAGKHFRPTLLSASDTVTQPTCFCMQLQQVHARSVPLPGRAVSCPLFLH